MHTFTTAHIVVDLKPVDGNQRCHVADFSDPISIPLGEKHTIGDGLKITVGMSFEDIPNALVHERLTTQKGVVESVPALARADDIVKLVGLHMKRLALLFNPAAMAAQVAGVGQGNEHKRWIKFFAADPRLIGTDRQHAFIHP